MQRDFADGSAAKMDYSANMHFDVPGKSGFTIEVKHGLCEYICLFLSVEAAMPRQPLRSFFVLLLLGVLLLTLAIVVRSRADGNEDQA